MWLTLQGSPRFLLLSSLPLSPCKHQRCHWTIIIDIGDNGNEPQPRPRGRFLLKPCIRDRASCLVLLFRWANYIRVKGFLYGGRRSCRDILSRLSLTVKVTIPFRAASVLRKSSVFTHFQDVYLLVQVEYATVVYLKVFQRICHCVQKLLDAPNHLVNHSAWSSPYRSLTCSECFMVIQTLLRSDISCLSEYLSFLSGPLTVVYSMRHERRQTELVLTQ